MAKKKKLPPPRKEVVVKSSTYSKHSRAARGSKTPAPVNSTLGAQADKTSPLNAAAKSVYDILKVYGKGFKEGQLWQAMLSRMRHADGTTFKPLLHSLETLELNSRYQSGRFGNVWKLNIEPVRGACVASLKTSVPPVLPKKDDCWQYELIALMFNSEEQCVHHALQSTAWLYPKDTPGAHSFRFNYEKRPAHVLFCLHLRSGVNGVATNTLPSRAMVIAGVYDYKP